MRVSTAIALCALALAPAFAAHEPTNQSSEKKASDEVAEQARLDAVKVDPKHYTVDFENDRVRVVRVHYGPHEKSARMHEHPGNSVGIYVTDFHAKVILADGRIREVDGKAGKSFWRAPAVRHTSTENLSDQPMEALWVEVKTPSGPRDASEQAAEQEVLTLEEEMEALQRSNSAERTAMWAEDMVYINNRGAAFDKGTLARALSAGEAKVESLEVTDLKVRVYGDMAVVTAMQHEKASYHGREARDVVQRYTRVWVRRNGKWQVVSFQATPISEPRVYALPTEGGALQKPQIGPNPGTDKPCAGSGLEQQIVSLDEESEEYRRRDQAGDKMLADDYVGVTVYGRLLDKRGTIELFTSGRVQTKSLEISGRNVRLYGDTAVVVVTRHLNDAIAGIPRQEQHRCTKVWVKRNGQWQVVSFQATKITGP